MDIIIGAGITGLSYAYFCKNSDYLILESEDSVGGYCRTTKRNGYVWDYSGHFFHFRNKDIEELLFSDISKDDILNVLKKTFIKYKDSLIDYPFQKNIHQLSKDEMIDCIYDLFNNDTNVYNTFKEMLYVKFGKSIAEKFLIPYNTKLYACDLNSLDKEAMGRFFPYANKEEIINNFKNTDNTSYNSYFKYPKGGAIEYINAIYKNIPQNNIRTNAKVVSIDKENKVVKLRNGEEIKYDRIISTMPFPELLKISDIEYDERIYSWNKVLVFNLGFDKKGKDIISHWLYFPEDKYCFYRVGFYDNIMNQDRMSLYVELGFNKDVNINPNEWLGTVIKDLKSANIIDEEQTLADYESIVMNPAYAHINEAVIEDVKCKKQLLENYDIYSIGRYGSWTYCSIEDNILEALGLNKKNNE